MGWLIARLAEMAGVSVAVSADNTNEALAIAALDLRRLPMWLLHGNSTVVEFVKWT